MRVMVYVFLCVYVFLKLHIAAHSGPVVLIILLICFSTRFDFPMGDHRYWFKLPRRIVPVQGGRGGFMVSPVEMIGHADPPYWGWAV